MDECPVCGGELFLVGEDFNDWMDWVTIYECELCDTKFEIVDSDNPVKADDE